MAEKTKNPKKRNEKEWIYQQEDRKDEKKEIAFFNGQCLIF